MRIQRYKSAYRRTEIASLGEEITAKGIVTPADLIDADKLRILSRPLISAPRSRDHRASRKTVTPVGFFRPPPALSGESLERILVGQAHQGPVVHAPPF
jgi:hypothetical protein